MLSSIHSFTSRQIPGLPRTTATSVKRIKKNITGIDGRIMDPIAQAATQHAAKAVRPPTSMSGDPGNRLAAAASAAPTQPQAASSVSGVAPAIPAAASNSVGYHVQPGPQASKSESVRRPASICSVSTFIYVSFGAEHSGCRMSQMKAISLIS